MGHSTGIAILSNYCTERKAIGWFEIPVKTMGRKGFDGMSVAKKIL
jgi:hydroxymethylglutaryl-CoA reductase